MWKTISSKKVYENKWWKVNLDIFKTDKGVQGEYIYIDSPGGVIIVPLTSENKIVLVKQYRYPNKGTFYEFPAGGIINSIQKSAKRELEEETGYNSKDIKKVAQFVPYTGLSNEICHVFIAKKLYKTNVLKEQTEELEVLEVPYGEVEQKLIETGDGKAITTWVLVKDILKLSNQKK